MTQLLARGANVGLTQVGLGPDIVVTLTWNSAPGVDADLSAFCCAATGKVRTDEDFVFYNQPHGIGGAVAHLGKSVRGAATTDRVRIRTAQVLADIEKIVIGASIDGLGNFGGLSGVGVEVAADENAPAAVRCEIAAGTETALVFAEVYRRDGEWKVRGVGQGYLDGLAGLATDFGVDVESDPAEASPSAGSSFAAPSPVGSPAPSQTSLSLEKARVIDLEKKLSGAGDAGMLSLVKSAGISLEKRGLGEHTARVALVLDISGSMSRLYRSGAVQRLAERVLALGLRFDDDGEVDVFLFGEEVHQLPQGLSLQGYTQFIDQVLAQYPLEYGTRYGAAITAVRKHYFGSSGDRTEPRPDATPVYVMFLTDGETSDKAVATKQIRAASYEPIFWQFMGIGGGKFSYLEKLDDLDRRYVDNADFFAVSNDELLGAMPIGDDALFAKLMTEYPGWLATARSGGLLR